MGCWIGWVSVLVTKGCSSVACLKIVTHYVSAQYSVVNAVQRIFALLFSTGQIMQLFSKRCNIIVVWIWVCEICICAICICICEICICKLPCSLCSCFQRVASSLLVEVVANYMHHLSKSCICPHSLWSSLQHSLKGEAPVRKRKEKKEEKTLVGLTTQFNRGGATL